MYILVVPSWSRVSRSSWLLSYEHRRGRSHTAVAGVASVLNLARRLQWPYLVHLGLERFLAPTDAHRDTHRDMEMVDFARAALRDPRCAPDLRHCRMLLCSCATEPSGSDCMGACCLGWYCGCADWAWIWRLGGRGSRRACGGAVQLGLGCDRLIVAYRTSYGRWTVRTWLYSGWHVTYMLAGCNLG